MDAARTDANRYKPDGLTYRINGAAMAVHSKLGAGLLESVYENALCIKFEKRGIQYERQKRFPVLYDGEDVGEMVDDPVVEEQVIVELKSVKELLPIHEAQSIAYLKAAKNEKRALEQFQCRFPEVRNQALPRLG